MARPRPSDGGSSLKIRCGSANILNKPVRGDPPAWELGERLTNLVKKNSYIILRGASDLDGFLGNDLRNGKWI
jgi:hypothetical protein